MWFSTADLSIIVACLHVDRWFRSCGDFRAFIVAHLVYFQVFEHVMFTNRFPSFGFVSWCISASDLWCHLKIRFGIRNLKIPNFHKILQLVSANVLKNAQGPRWREFQCLAACWCFLFVFIFIPWYEALFIGEAFRQSRGGATKMCARVFQLDFFDVKRSWNKKGRPWLGVIFNGGSFYHSVMFPRGPLIPVPRRLSSIHGGTVGAFSNFWTYHVHK